VINGTPIGDVFAMTENFVMGAGRQVVFEPDVERIELNTGGGDDEIYILSTNDAIETVVRGGSGNYTIHLGGDHPVAIIDPPPEIIQGPGITVENVTEEIIEIEVDPEPFTTVVSAGELGDLTALGARLGGTVTVIDVITEKVTIQEFVGSSFFGLFTSFRTKTVELPVSAVVSVDPKPFIEEKTVITTTFETIASPPIGVDPPPFAFKVDPVFDLTGIKGKLIIDGSETVDSLDNPHFDQVIVHNEQGADRIGSLTNTTVPDREELTFQVFVDANGNEILVVDPVEGLPKDPDGELLVNLVRVSDEPIYKVEGSDKPIYEAPPDGAAEKQVPGQVPVLDGNGDPVLDETGNPVLEDGLVPVFEGVFAQGFETDEQGRVRFDESGSPILQSRTFLNLQGLGTGTGIGRDGVAFSGVELKNLEDMEIFLSDGDDDFTIEATVTGNTSLILGDGNDHVKVTAIDGDTRILGGEGNDTVDVWDQDESLAGIDAKLTIDGDADVRDVPIPVTPDDPIVTGSDLVFVENGIAKVNVSEVNPETGEIIEELVEETLFTSLRKSDGSLANITTETVVQGATPTNEVQVLYHDGDTGSFTLSYGGLSTGLIFATATAAEVEAALEQLPNLGNVTVTGKGTVARPWLIEFSDSGGLDVPEIVPDFSDLNRLIKASSRSRTTDDGGESIFKDDEEQSLSHNGTVGTFTLNFRGQTTVELPASATAYQVVAALNALPAISSRGGVFIVGGNGSFGSPWKLEFDSNANESQIWINPRNLFREAPASGKVSTLTQGGSFSQNEVQRIFHDGTSGEFVLTFSGQKTTPIAFNASASELEDALDALTSVGDVTVTGVGTAAEPWVIEFVDPAQENVLPIEANPQGTFLRPQVVTRTVELNFAQKDRITEFLEGEDTLNIRTVGDSSDLIGTHLPDVELVTKLDANGRAVFHEPGSLVFDPITGEQLFHEPGTPVLGPNGLPLTNPDGSPILHGDNDPVLHGKDEPVRVLRDVEALTGLNLKDKSGNATKIIFTGLDENSVNINLGAGNDVIQVESTLQGAVTNLNTGGGDDVITLSSAGGSLDDILGNLNIDAGSGVNVLNVDDSADPDADPDVVITDSSISGLAPALITYTATGGTFESQFDPATGAFSDGITISAGTGENPAVIGLEIIDYIVIDPFGIQIPVFGPVLGPNGNIIAIESTRNDGNIIEVTRVNAGAGDDVVTITETDFGGQNGNGNGNGGSHHETIDAHRYLVVQGQTGDDTIDASATSEGVTLFGNQGTDLITGGMGNDVLVGGLGDDSDRNLNDALIDGGIFGGAGNDVLLGDRALIIRDEAYVVQRIETRDEDQGGIDELFGEFDNDVLLGGAGGDLLRGDVASGGGSILGSSLIGTDIILGDNGVVVREDGSGEANDVFSRSHIVGGVDVIAGGDGDNIIIGGALGDIITGGTGNEIILGDGGRIIRNENDVATQVSTQGDATGGVDTIDGAAGNDIILGGAEGDMISAEFGNNIILGDAGEINLNNADSNDIFTTSPDVGGADEITGGGDGSNVIIGGAMGDMITGGIGNDTILGDSGSIFRDGNGVVKRVRTGGIGDENGKIGGVDTIDGDDGNDVILGGAEGDIISAELGDNIILGDGGQVTLGHIDPGSSSASYDIASTSPAVGAGDTITISGAGTFSNIVLGGAAGDTITIADPDQQGNVGDEQNVVLGDNGTVRRQLRDGAIVVTQVATGDADGQTGGDDTITNQAGNNIILGDNGVVNLNSTANDVFTTESKIGGVNTIVGGDGANILIGGAMGDVITGGIGNDTILGDSGSIFRDGNGVVKRVRTGGIGDESGEIGGVDTIDGGDGNDVILGGAEGDIITAELGDNIILGDNGDVNQNNTDSNDVFTTQPDLGGVDIITGGGNGSNIIIGGAAGDIITGGTGDDVILGDGGTVTRDGGMQVLKVRTIDDATGGIDEIDGFSGNDLILGGAEGDRISAKFGNNIILGDAGEINLNNANSNDIFTTSPDVGGEDTITGGGDGSNVIIGGAMGDVITGGIGNDTILGDNGRVVRGADNVVTRVVTGDEEGITGGDDTITSNAGTNVILGGVGSDTIRAPGGDNIILGDNGEVNLNSVFNDVLTTQPDIGGVDNITGGTGSNIILGGAKGDLITGGYGNDTILGDNIILGDNGEVNLNSASNDVFTTEPDIGGVDIITGGSGSNIILGGARGDTITGGIGRDVILGDNGRVFRDTHNTVERVETTDSAIGGADTIRAGGNDDIVLGGADRDDIHGNGGEDILLGDNGIVDASLDSDPDIDRVVVADPAIGADDFILGNTGNDIIMGGTGDDFVSGGLGDDTLFGDHGDVAIGETRDAIPIFTGPEDGNGNDTVHGDAGDDTIFGGSGDDTLFGEQGNDTIFGMAGNDVMLGDVGFFVASFDSVGIRHLDVLLADVIQVTGSFNDNGTPLLEGSHAADVLGLDLVVVDDRISLGQRVPGGDDLLEGGTGADALFGQEGDDTLRGGSGSNYLSGDAGSDILEGGDDRDILLGDGGLNLAPDAGEIPHVIHGFVLTETEILDPFEADIEFTSTYDTVIAKARLEGDGFAAISPLWITEDAQIAGLLHDADIGGAFPILFNQVAFAGGDDTIRGNGGDDVLVGDFGTHLDASVNTAPIVVGLLQGSGGIFGPTAGGSEPVAHAAGVLDAVGPMVEHLAGLTGDLQSAVDAQGDARRSLSETVFGGDSPASLGNVTIVGGNDKLFGGIGNDTLVGDHSLVLGSFVTGSEFIPGDTGNTRIQRSVTLFGGNDHLDGGEGNDQLQGDSTAVLAPFARIATESVYGTHHQVEVEEIRRRWWTYTKKRLISHPFHERSQTGHMDVVEGLTIVGGHDTLFGGTDDDLLRGDNQVIIAPKVSLSSSTMIGVQVDGTGVEDRLFGSESFDLMSDIEIVGGNDIIDGGAGSDTAIGDNETVVAPLVSITESVVHVSERFDHPDHPVIHHGHHIYDSRLVHDVHLDRFDDIIDQLVIAGGQDEITGDSGGDRLMGDNNTLVIPRIEWTRDAVFEPVDAYGNGHHHHDYDNDWDDDRDDDWSDDDRHHHHVPVPVPALVDASVILGSLDIFGTDDVIRGGADDDLIMGDGQTLIAPVLTMNASETHSFSGSHHHDHHHDDDDHVHFHGIGSHWPNHDVPADVVSSVTITGGGDALFGDGGNDQILGDGMTFVAPNVDIALTEKGDSSGKWRHHHRPHYGHHHGDDDDHFHGHYSGYPDPSDSRDIIDRITLNSGQDTLNGGEESDALIGDDAIMVAPIIDVSVNTEIHIDDSDRRSHGDTHRHHDLIFGNLIRDLTVIGNTDHLYGGIGADLAVGDALAKIAPEMSVTIHMDTIHREEDASTTDMGHRKHRYYDYHHDHDHYFEDTLLDGPVDTVSIFGAVDGIDGEAGDDAIIGDNSLFFDSTTSVDLNGEFDHEHLKATKRKIYHYRHHDHHQVHLGPTVNHVTATGADDTVNGGEDNDLAVGDSHAGFGGMVALRANGQPVVDPHHHHYDRDDDDDYDHHRQHSLHIEAQVHHMSLGSGDDNMAGGAGNDVMMGDNTSVQYRKHPYEYRDWKDWDDDDDDHRHSHGIFVDGVDHISTTGGRDRIFGGDGDDALFGQAGRDMIYGEAGRDTIYGGRDYDKISGGPGRDKTRSGSPSQHTVDQITGARLASMAETHSWVADFLLDFRAISDGADPNADIRVILHEGNDRDDD